MKEGSEEEVAGLVDTLKAMKSLLTKDRRSEFKDDVIEEIRKVGWSGERKIFPSTSNISITSTKRDLGLCLQLGNIARYYADIVKLQHMHHTGRISQGILIVYHGEAARRLFSGGGNLATFERVTRELQLMIDSVSYPLTVIGIG